MMFLVIFRLTPIDMIHILIAFRDIFGPEKFFENSPACGLIVQHFDDFCEEHERIYLKFLKFLR
jgi:hypothetical protein